MRRTIEHILFWVSFILFKVIMNLLDNAPNTPDTIASGLFEQALFIFYSQFPYFTIYIPVTYILFYLIERYFAGSISFLAITFFSLLTLLISLPITDIVNHEIILPYVYNTYEYPLDFNLGSLAYYGFNIISVVGIACAIKLSRKQVQSITKEQELKREKVEAELKFLKAQVSPHFLFNTLNNIYSLARKRSEITAEAVMKLSQLLRFMLYDASKQQIALSEEVKLIRDYIALEQLRYTERLTVNFSHEIDNPHQPIAPLILIHFVENAFKHGAGESRFDVSIDIHIKLTGSNLEASFSNTKGEAPLHIQEVKIGLINTRRQLELLYSKHELKITSTENIYSVKLSINLKNDDQLHNS